jgi:Peptidase family C25/Propeptide_C25
MYILIIQMLKYNKENINIRLLHELWGARKMKSTILFVVSILVLSGFSALSLGNAGEKQESLQVSFSEPMVVQTDGFVEIHLDGATTTLSEENRPVLPIYVKTYQIPFRSTDIQVTCTAQNIGSMHLSRDVLPARIVTLSEESEHTGYEQDPSVYGSTEFYPGCWYRYDLGAGRNDEGVQVTFVKIICYPVRYSPLTRQIQYAGGFDIQLSYQKPTTPQQSSTEEYDMVIIAPSKFRDALTPLVEHKNSKGLVTKFASMEDILATYDGFDQPEQIKKFIKNEFDSANITYVLLVGGLKSHLNAEDKDTRSAGWKAWWVPVRYVTIPREDDEGCLSDLYYGCLYNGTGVFDSWDSNGDGIYAAWGAPGVPKDTFDLYPEVYVSRIPCVSVREVKAAVKKITTYESTGPEAKPWYKNFVGVAGKTFYLWQGIPDGEYLTTLAYNNTKNAVPGLQLTECYASNRDIGGRTPTPLDILKSLNEGAGFVDFEGHGDCYAWNTIWHDGVYPENWAGGFNVFFYPLLINGKKLPVVIVGGCHNGLYNVSMLAAYRDVNNTDYFCPIPSPVCFSAGLVLKAWGGAIGSTGSTGYGLGASGDPASDLSAKLETYFFYEIGQGSTHLAQSHSQAIQKYVSEEDIAVADAYCITEWALFGDASLLFGGYSS